MTTPSNCGPGARAERVSFIGMILNCVLAGIGAGLPVALLLACITLLLA